MAKRKDGKKRKAQLLEAATMVFAEKGFRDTTISDISTAAKANVASVNYYYGSKVDLYAEVWKNAFHRVSETYPLDGGLGPSATAEQRLKALIQSFLHRMLDSGALGHSGQILLTELASPTEAIKLVKKDAIMPLRQKLKDIIKGLLGEKATEDQIALCAMSVIHQCLAFGMKRGKIPPVIESLSGEELFDALVEHITLFSKAGIAAVKNSNQQ
jgi:TetR/AcrR family transcriptional regulator, regulator of cefoperazone and chloramphenicol sensitivity